MNVQCIVISTGSQGNAVVIANQILIDCGVPYKAIEPYVPQLRLVLLTHIHGDHFRASTLRHLVQERPGIRFGCCRWLVPDLVHAGVPTSRIDLLETGKAARYTFCTVTPVLLKHDVPNCGYKLLLESGKRVFYATDTNDLNGIEARNYDLYLVEANYTDEDIQQRLAEKKETGEYPYEHRVLEYHLSRAKCDDFIYKNIGPTGEYIYLHGHVDKDGGLNNERKSI